MTTLDRHTVLERLNAEALLLQRFGLRYLGLFGSFVRNEADLESDLDILYEFEPDQVSLRNFVRLHEHLETLFGRRVELVPRRYLNPRIGPYILAEVETVIDTSDADTDPLAEIPPPSLNSA